MIFIGIHLIRSEFTLAVDAEFDDGITAVFGPSGAGKSTLLGCISGAIRPDKGLITIGERTLFDNNQSISVVPEKRRVGMVYQDGALFPHLDVRGNIEFGYRLLAESERLLSLPDLVDFLGLSNLMNRKPDELSGGERQRVAIARALATSPDLLLLDEPMASLDAPSRGLILNYLRRVHTDFGIPMIYVSHSMSEVVSIASHALILSEGKVAGFGVASSLLGNPVAYGSISNGRSPQQFDNILYGTVRDSTDNSTVVRVGTAEIECGLQNRIRGENVAISIGANQIILGTTQLENISARNVLKGKVTEIWANDTLIFVEIDVGTKLISELTRNALTELGITVGNNVFVVFKSTSVDVYET